jgi:hypothetical protein
MSTLSSSKIEAKFAGFHEDGLVDIFIGIGVILAGLFLLTEMVWMAAIFIPTCLPSFRTARKRILESRLESGIPSAQKQMMNQKYMFLITILLGVMVLAGSVMGLSIGLLSNHFQDWFQHNFLLILGMVFAIVWIIAGALLSVKRFYRYSGISFLTLFLTQLMGLPFWFALAVIGVLISCNGLFLLIRFLRHYPPIK